jgi:hypothetical protein
MKTQLGQQGDPTMPGRLRYFLYRDDRILDQFLEQLEGGVYDEERIHQQATGGGTLGVGVKAGPLTGNASRDRSSSSESELNLRQTGFIPVQQVLRVGEDRR